MYKIQIITTLILACAVPSQANAQLNFGNILNQLKNAIDKAAQENQGANPSSQSASTPSSAQTQQNNQKADFTPLKSLTGKIWSFTNPRDRDEKPCLGSDDRDIKGLTRVTVFKIEESGNLKVAFTLFGRGKNYIRKTLDLNSISKISENSYRVGGSWTNVVDDRKPTLPYEVTISLGATPTLLDERFREIGLPDIQTSEEPTILTECSAQQVALLSKTDEQVEREQSQAKATYDASPEGKRQALQEKYALFMGAQDCHEVRRNYVVKYVDNNVFDKVKSAMKTIENNAKRDSPGINTDQAWAQATKQYKQSPMGQTLDFNKKLPQNIDKDARGYCDLAVWSILNSVPQEAPKKGF